MSQSEPGIRYTTAEVVVEAGTDTDPATASDALLSEAKRRAAAATEKWIKRTGRPFHPVRVGAVDEPQSWEVHDVHEATSWHPAVVHLDNHNPLPLDTSEGDAIEVRTGRDSWEDITEQYGDEWTLDARRKRLRIFHRRVINPPFDDPNRRFCRLTYRYGPLGEEVQINSDDVVTSVPADVAEAVAAKAATMLALDDDALASVPDNGQLTARSTKRQALVETWEETCANYSGFSTL